MGNYEKRKFVICGEDDVMMKKTLQCMHFQGQWKGKNCIG